MLIKGNLHTDSRGILRYVNEFNFEGIKRFYTITHPNTNIIRAWQGHKKETKYFYVTKGSFLINWIELDNFENPAKNLIVQSKIFSDKQSEVLIIPPGHVNGLKALEPYSSILVFSDLTLEESNSDNFRWKLDYFNANWDKII